MKIYIIRHGQDDDTVRGGWSDAELTEMGICQANALADELYKNSFLYGIKKIYSSDLKRAAQTSEIIGEKLGINVEYLCGFREVNNGDLAGMKNEVADINFPNLYWRKLKWTQKYPNGESPEDFYNRIFNEWNLFIDKNRDCDYNILLVTHGGVMNVIRTIVNNEQYSNQKKYSGIQPCNTDFFVEV